MALQEPMTITKNGRDRLVVISAEEYSRLKRRDRRVVKLEDFAEEEMALIAATEPAAGQYFAFARIATPGSRFHLASWR